MTALPVTSTARTPTPGRAASQLIAAAILAALAWELLQAVDGMMPEATAAWLAAEGTLVEEGVLLAAAGTAAGLRTPGRGRRTLPFARPRRGWMRRWWMAAW